MVAHIGTVAFVGIEARLVDVQVQIASGLPSLRLHASFFTERLSMMTQMSPFVPLMLSKSL